MLDTIKSSVQFYQKLEKCLPTTEVTTNLQEELESGEEGQTVPMETKSKQKDTENTGAPALKRKAF